MAYDFEGTTDYGAPKLHTPVAQPKDLEAIVMLLELAAIELSPTPGTEFTFAELLGQANEIGGGEVVIEENDAQIVLEKARFVSKKGKRFSLRCA